MGYDVRMEASLLRLFFILTCTFVGGGCSASGASHVNQGEQRGSPSYSHEGRPCQTDADCPIRLEDEVVATMCSDGRCIGITCIEPLD